MAGTLRSDPRKPSPAQASAIGPQSGTWPLQANEGPPWDFDWVVGLGTHSRSVGAARWEWSKCGAAEIPDADGVTPGLVSVPVTMLL